MHTPLGSCPHCDGFIPPQSPSCPHCNTALPTPPSRPNLLQRIRRSVLLTTGGGILATTLMACYGAPPPPNTVPDTACERTDTDKDGDCVPATTDCDDSDPAVKECKK